MTLHDSGGNELRSPPFPEGEDAVVGEIGGGFDQTQVVLSYSSEDLKIDEVSTVLGLTPTKAWEAGQLYPVGDGSSGVMRKSEWGRWILRGARDTACVGAKILELLDRGASDPESWVRISAKHDACLTVIGYLTNWNRELLLSPQVLRALSDRGLALRADVYFEEGAES